SQRPKKWKRFRYHDVVDTQQTLEEQMDQYVRNAEEEVRKLLGGTEPVSEAEPPSVSADAQATISRAMQAPQTTSDVKSKLKMGDKKEKMDKGKNVPVSSSHTAMTPSISTATPSQVLLTPSQVLLPPIAPSNDSSPPERPLIQAYNMPRNPIPLTESPSTPLTASTTTVPALPPQSSQRPLASHTPTRTRTPIGSTHTKQSPLSPRPGPWHPSALCQGSVVRDV
ncbi:MAG: hypothetical protein Q9183_007601, partial [Haloplaca sp. 2 TL-2023]